MKTRTLKIRSVEKVGVNDLLFLNFFVFVFKEINYYKVFYLNFVFCLVAIYTLIYLLLLEVFFCELNKKPLSQSQKNIKKGENPPLVPKTFEVVLKENPKMAKIPKVP